MGKLEKAKDRINWMRENRRSVKWQHATQLLGWLGIDHIHSRGSHTFWQYLPLVDSIGVLELVKPHGKRRGGTMSVDDVIECADYADFVLSDRSQI